MSSGRTVLSTWAASAREAVATCASTALRWPDRPGAVLVTGSSGKGTTCRMLAEVLRAARLHPVLTAEGARPWSGVASAMGASAGVRRLRSGPRELRLVEVEAAALPHLARRIARPAALVCTNILRGQSDDDTAGAALAARLEGAIRSLPASTTLILNADDPQVAVLAAGLPNPRLYFGMSDPVHGRVRPDPTAEVACCPRCGDRLCYTSVYYAHLGHWACGGCGLSRPEPDIGVTKVGVTRSSSGRLQVETSPVKATIEVPLPGMYNAYNALAAVTVATHLGLPAWSLRAIENVSGGPMRMELAHVAGRDVYLTVAASATEYTEVLRAILGDGEPRWMLLGLSARRHPQQDISWIWNVDFESLAGLVPAPVVCGNRAADLGVRLKYAGWLGDASDRGSSAGARIEPDPVRAARAAIGDTPPGHPLWIVSTATELAHIRRWLRSHDDAPDLEADEGRQDFRSGRRVAVRAGLQAGGPRLTGTLAAGPQPSGPPRSGPQPTAPSPSRRRLDRSGRRGWSGRRQPRQAGAPR